MATPDTTCKKANFKNDLIDDWLIDTSLSSYHEKATVRYALDESTPA